MDLQQKQARLAKLEELKELRDEQAKRVRNRKLNTYYPDTGPLRRELYGKHLEFFRTGKTHKQRLALCANRVGKTEGMGGCETTYHVTGLYPAWWEGYRYDRPIVAWVAGETAKDVRDSLQLKLLGAPNSRGCGIIPGDCLGRMTSRSGVPDAIDTAYIKHVSGGFSSIAFKAYEQGRESFQAADVDLLWLDEEPSLAIYIEALTRTMTTNGRVLLTFTPLQGMSETVLQFLPDGRIGEFSDETRAVITCTWDDVPHLLEQQKNEMLASYPPFQRDARTKGIPQLGAGAIYPVEESRLLCDPILIPSHWPQGYGMDVGWNATAALWGALDRDTDTLYLKHEYKRGQCEPAVHVHGIAAPGKWIPGFIDPASRGRSQKDGSTLVHDYKNLGLNLHFAENAVESGLYAIWQRMEAGKLKVFRNLSQWLAEFRLYRRDEKGHVVKQNDHLMDCMRYLESGLSKMKVKPLALPDEPKPSYYVQGDQSRVWMN